MPERLDFRPVPRAALDRTAILVPTSFQWIEEDASRGRSTDSLHQPDVARPDRALDDRGNRRAL
ncbi:hypothetical protein SPHINGOAX6_70992 [Sphingomonas sp. AX6]|nr:hypothetical protein SPHINGOAX6_70992 [Sphingomonas sp. AX6]